MITDGIQLVFHVRVEVAGVLVPVVLQDGTVVRIVTLTIGRLRRVSCVSVTGEELCSERIVCIDQIALGVPLVVSVSATVIEYVCESLIDAAHAFLPQILFRHCELRIRPMLQTFSNLRVRWRNLIGKTRFIVNRVGKIPWSAPHDTRMATSHAGLERCGQACAALVVDRG